MTILIDGYNLLHAAGLVGRRMGPGGLERARHGLVGLLAASLTPEEAARTIVVFDGAREALRDLPQAEALHGIDTRYSRPGQDADALLEELIAADSAPRTLTVVSSDHRVQQVALRRRSQAVDSETWWDELLARRRRGVVPTKEAAKPEAPLNADEVEQWLKEFGVEPPE